MRGDAETHLIGIKSPEHAAARDATGTVQVGLAHGFPAAVPTIAPGRLCGSKRASVSLTVKGWRDGSRPTSATRRAGGKLQAVHGVTSEVGGTPLTVAWLRTGHNAGD